MAAITNELQGVNGFWRRTTAVGATDVLAAKSGYYPVIEWYAYEGVGGAAAGTLTVRSKTTTTTIGLTCKFATTTLGKGGQSGLRIAMADGEALEIVLAAGTAPTDFALTFGGRYLATNTPISDNKTGAIP